MLGEPLGYTVVIFFVRNEIPWIYVTGIYVTGSAKTLHVHLLVYFLYTPLYF